jgi:adenylate cyclase
MLRPRAAATQRVRGATVSANFDHALAREVLRTELIRVKAVIATALLLFVVLWQSIFSTPKG